MGGTGGAGAGFGAAGTPSFRGSPALPPCTPHPPQRGHPLGRGRPRQRTHRARAQRCRGQRRRRLSPGRPDPPLPGPQCDELRRPAAAAAGDQQANQVASRLTHFDARAAGRPAVRRVAATHSRQIHREFICWEAIGDTRAPEPRRRRAWRRRWVADKPTRVGTPSYAAGLRLERGGGLGGGLNRWGQRPRTRATRGSEQRGPCFEPSWPINQLQTSFWR